MPGHGRRFTPEELARSAAAGEPRLETDFFDAGAWRAYQDQWFAAMTGGEVLLVLTPQAEVSGA